MGTDVAGANVLLPLAVAVPLLGAVLLAVAGRRLPRLGCDVLATLCAAAEVACVATLWARTGDGRAVTWLGGWRPEGPGGHGVGIVLEADRVGGGMALLVAVLVLAVLAYSWRYFEEPGGDNAGTFPALLLLFEAGMCGFALTGDLFNAFVFFELMGVVAYSLTGYRIEDGRPLQGALAFGLVNSLGAYASLMGIALLYARTGELGFAAIARQLAREGGPDALVVCGFVLVMTGLLVKAAVVPFHLWLPDAHAVAPTPVCMLLSGVMVELGVYGVARVYWAVFSGPGGIPHHALRDTLTAAGVLTALVGAVMCWQQRHLKRLLAFSTISHVGLFLVGLATLTPLGTAGTAVYVAGHAGAKAALFGLTGVLLDRYGSVDEHGLYGRARGLVLPGALYAVGGLVVAGLPPFGTGLGKALAEEAAGHWQGWLPAVFVLASALTGGAVLRAALRVFRGAGPRPQDRPWEPETSGEGEEPEIHDPRRRLPAPMVAVPAVLLLCSLAVGVVPSAGAALASAGAAFTDHAGYLAAAFGPASPAVPAVPVPPAHWNTAGVLLGLLSTALAVAVAAAAVWGPGLTGALPGRARSLATAATQRAVLPLRRLHSGLPGDYVAWLTVGVAALLVAFGAQSGIG
ncbi:complex I subunit 5 family protein [Streptomyces sp. MI02-7b]|uniref:complex I subunit 5 family protein n=1 Tax=Streptomyces sp. MI02-7b TaxID=462941 RepID=UPI0029B7F815|nr:proton-conducting transporter membrane subunit [Streptomyces sp. MI02-7b]MDX3076216.1 proton-conducting transporter membrane subunit [Streptomyces sp. MI02-7b]